MKLSDFLENTHKPIACVVQGGGMRGTFSIAALAELERSGYSDRFSSFYGSSAGALNSAYFIANQAVEGVGIYVNHLSNKKFINPSRIKPIIDIDYLIDDVLTKQVPLNKEKVLSSSIDLNIYLTNAETGKKEKFQVNNENFPLMEVLRATAALPIVFGKEIEIHGKKYVDGGLADQLPLLDAIDDGWNDILVILTRPTDYLIKPKSQVFKLILMGLGKLSGHSKGVIKLLKSNNYVFNDSLEKIKNKNTTQNIWVIAPPKDEFIAKRLTNDFSLLNHTSKVASEATQKVLNLGPFKNIESTIAKSGITSVSSGLERGSGL